MVDPAFEKKARGSYEIVKFTDKAWYLYIFFSRYIFDSKESAPRPHLNSPMGRGKRRKTSSTVPKKSQ